jgi:branched-chain amino acid transport system substrate-binding protein
VNCSAVTQYLKAVRAAGTKESGPVLKALHAMPVNDLVTPGGTVRADGRLVRPTYLLKVKPTDQVKRKYDVFTLLREIPGSEAFRPLSESACPLNKS